MAAFRSRLQTLEIENTRNFLDLRQFLNSAERIVIENISSGLARHNNLKVNLILFAEFKRGEEHQLMNFRTRNEIITPTTIFNEFYTEAIQRLLDRVEEFEIRGSQWVLNRIHSLELGINRYKPLRDRSYVPLPSVLANKKAIINVQNKDDRCFLWAVLSALHPASKDAQRDSKYRQWENEFDEDLFGIEFPVKLTGISKFAKRTNMSINVYTFDDKSIVPLEITKDEKEMHIDLLYYKSHYCWIYSLEKLVGSQFSKYKFKKFICRMCLSLFYSEKKLNDYKTYCQQHKCAKILMPKLYDNILEFKNYNISLKVPFVVYADFECMLKKIDKCQPSDDVSYAKPFQKHVPTNFSYYVKYTNGNIQPPVTYSGADTDKVFYHQLKEDVLYISRNFYDRVVPIIPLTVDEEHKFKTEKVCHICERSFDDLTPMLENKILFTKKAIQYYKYLNNEKCVDKYTKSLKT